MESVKEAIRRGVIVELLPYNQVEQVLSTPAFRNNSRGYEYSSALLEKSRQLLGESIPPFRKFENKAVDLAGKAVQFG